MQLSWNHPQRTRERDVSGLILQEMYGLPSGMPASWVCISMLPMNGKNGNCQVKNLNLTQFLLMITIWSGSVILVLMLSCGLIHTYKNFNLFHYRVLMLKYVNFLAGLERYWVQNLV